MFCNVIYVTLTFDLVSINKSYIFQDSGVVIDNVWVRGKETQVPCHNIIKFWGWDAWLNQLECSYI
jgi:hypothetical protein